MARHTYGCRVIQRLVEHCTVEQLTPLMDGLVEDLKDLAEDEYGNYVLQTMSERLDTPNRPVLMQIISSQIMELSCNKFASNVCEKALVYSSEEGRDEIVRGILGDAPPPEQEEGAPEPPLFVMMRDRYANYIVQRMIELARGPLRDELQTRLESQVELLKTFTYGKHIVSALTRAGIIKEGSGGKGRGSGYHSKGKTMGGMGSSPSIGYKNSPPI